MNEEQYLKGNRNFFIRVYFYLSNGLSIVNEFRNLLLGIFGVYITLKLEHPMIMVGLFVVAVIILVPVGYFMVHYVSKVKEWLGTKFGSHYAIKNFDYMKRQCELLEEVLKEIQCLKKENTKK